MATASGNYRNDPGLAGGFFDGANQAQDYINRVRTERGLADIEAAPAAATGGQVTTTPAGLGDVGQNDDKAYGAADAQAGIAQGTAVDNSPATTTTAPINYSVMGRTGDTAEAARSAARASVMRSNGAPDEANRDQQAFAQIGLTNANRQKADLDVQEGIIKLRGATRNDADAQKMDDIRKTVAQYAQGSGADNKTVSGASDLAAFHLQQLLKAGLPEEAAKASKAYTDTIIQSLKGTDAQRQEAAVGVQSALQDGSPVAMKLALKNLDQYLPNGGRVDDVQPGPQPGTYVVTRTEADGSKSTKTVDKATIGQMLDMTTGSQFDKTSTSFVKNRLDIDNVKAQINAHNASAGASSASAANSREQITERQYDFGQRKGLDAVYKIPEKDRTPDQQALIDGEQEKSEVKYAGRGKGAGKDDVEGNVKVIDPAVGLAVAKIKDTDGVVKMMERSRKNPAWTPITTSTAAKAQAAGVPVDGGAAPSPSSASPANMVDLSTSKDPMADFAKLPSGSVVKFPNGAMKMKP